MKPFNYLLFLSLGMVVSGCITMPVDPSLKLGEITQTQSDFDGAKQIKMSPVWLWASSTDSYSFRLGLFKNSKMAKENVVMEAVYAGAESISKEGSLEFNVDGEFFRFSPIDEVTNIRTGLGGYGLYPSFNESSRQYLVTTDFIRKIVHSKRTVGRLSFSDNSYTEGDVVSAQYDEYQYPSLIGAHYKKPRAAFEDFLKVAESVFSEGTNIE